MKELIEYIAKALVDYPDDVAITEKDGDLSSVIELKVAKSDLGKVIGKQGRTARAIRTVLERGLDQETRDEPSWKSWNNPVAEEGRPDSASGLLAIRMSETRLVVIGQVAGPFGIKGEIRIRSFAESFDAFERASVLVFDDIPREVLRVRMHKGAALVFVQGIESPEDAAKLAGQFVKIDAENLPPKGEDEYLLV